MVIKRDAIYLGVILILAIILFVVTCSGPAEYDQEADEYKDSIKVLKSQKAFKAAQYDSISSMANTLVKEKDSVVAASLREISRLRAKASTAVQNIPVRVMEEYPEVPIALAYLDSVNQKQSVLIDTLKSQVEFDRNVREQLTALHYDQSKIETNLFELCELRNIQLQEMNDRLRKKAKGKGLLFGLGFGLGWLARSGADRL